jgi:hypothetical protein
VDVRYFYCFYFIFTILLFYVDCVYDCNINVEYSGLLMYKSQTTNYLLKIVQFTDDYDIYHQFISDHRCSSGNESLYRVIKKCLCTR